MFFCWGKIGEVEIGGVKLSDISKFTKSKSSAEVIDFLYDITQTDKFKEEFDKIKARKAVNDSSEDGGFGGRGEEDLVNQQKATDDNYNTDNSNNMSLSKENIAISDEMGYKGEDGDTVVYRRVQGGVGTKTSRQRIIVNNDNSITIQDKTFNLNISIDNGEHSSYFRDNARRNDSNIIEFDVPKWLDDFLKEYTIPQKNYNSNPFNQGKMAPKLVDPTKPGKAFELPAPWIEWLEEYARNGRYKK